MSILMPKATATWLIENTALSFIQIAEFVGLHELEIKAIADGEGTLPLTTGNPVHIGLLSAKEIARCSADPSSRLCISRDYRAPVTPLKGRRYTPMLKRANKPNAVAWLVREYPEMNDTQINKLTGSTKPTIQAIRDRSHWNISNIVPNSPVELGLCTLNVMQTEIDIALERRGDVEPEVTQEEEKPIDYYFSNTPK